MVVFFFLSKQQQNTTTFILHVQCRFETSAKENKNIDRSFDFLVTRILEHSDSLEDPATPKDEAVVQPTAASPSSSSGFPFDWNWKWEWRC